MKPLKIGDNLTLEVGDFIIISCGNQLDYGWYCGQGNFGSTLQYYSVRTPGYALEEFEKYEAGEETAYWMAERFKRHKKFNSKCFYKRFLNSYYESRILKPANPDDLFSDPEDIQAYKKSKEALIKIKFL